LSGDGTADGACSSNDKYSHSFINKRDDVQK